MDSNNIRSFNERLSQWIAQQGFWFQLRHSRASGSGLSTVTYHLFRMAFRMLLVLLLAVVGFWWFLVKRVETQEFKRWMTRSFSEQMGASEARIDGFRRTQGRLDITRLGCVGGPDAFFTKLDAANVRCRMGLLDSFHGVWEAGPLAARQLTVEVKAGADDPELAKRAGEALFRRYPKFSFPSVESDDTTVRWGYSPRTYGLIEHSRLSSQRLDGAWNLQFRGGWFTQNWLSRLEIVELTAVCDANGMRIERGVLKSQDGTIELIGVKVGNGEQPEVTGTLKFTHVPLETLLPKRLQGVLEGNISGQFQLHGSTNSGDGIGFDGLVTLADDDAIVLRDRIYLLRALQVVDGGVNGFRKVVFREGSFAMRTLAGKLELRDVKLKADEVMTLAGGLLVRLPTQAEVDAGLTLKRGEGDLAPLFAKEAVSGDEGMLPSGHKEGEVNLKQAALAQSGGNRGKAGEERTEGDFYERLGFLDSDRRLQQRAAELLLKDLRYEGGFRITLPASAFTRAPELNAQYPVDPSTGRVSLDVPVQGGIDEITLQQAEALYEKGRRKD